MAYCNPSPTELEGKQANSEDEKFKVRKDALLPMEIPKSVRLTRGGVISEAQSVRRRSLRSQTFQTKQPECTIAELIQHKLHEPRLLPSETGLKPC